MSRAKIKPAALAKKHGWKAAIVLAVGVGAIIFFNRDATVDPEATVTTAEAEAALTAPVTVGPFKQHVIESGEVESSSNLEIRCEVDIGSAGITILEIVPEGTYVKEGDFLVRLDDAALKDKMIGRQIDVNTSKASLAQSKADKESAVLELAEYESGTFIEQEEQMESEIFVAEENHRRAKEYLLYSERLSQKGYVSEVQLEADRFAVEKSEKELEVAKTKLEVLRK
ncbi:MAG: hypothetical protein AAF585_24295, partial [Verrucomicrobiota bacterium]